jgi:hypothetical protein
MSDREARSATVITTNPGCCHWLDRTSGQCYLAAAFCLSTLTEAPSLSHTLHNGSAHSFDPRCEARHVDRPRHTRLLSLQLAMAEK